MKKIFIIAVATLLLTVLVDAADHIGFIYPAGGRAGETFEVVIGGKGMGNLRKILLDGSDGHENDIEVVDFEVAPGGLFVFANKEQRAFVTKWVKAVQSGGAAPTQPQDISKWDRRKKYWFMIDKLTPLQFEMVCIGLFNRRDPLQMSPSLSQRIIVKMKISPNARLGRRQLRLVGTESRSGVSNPVPFYIGSVPEVLEPRFQAPPQNNSAPSFSIPGVINGQISPGDTDQFKFYADGGSEITFTLHGRDLLPFIGDGVPGHFQALMRVLDADGKEVVFADDNYFDPDPVLYFKALSSGVYTLEVRDALFRGREDFVYRVDAINGHVPYCFLPLPDYPIARVNAAGLERNGRIPFPCMIEGVLAKPGDKADFAVALSKGDIAVFEVFSRRLNSPVDAILKVFGPNGKLLMYNDDFPRPKIGKVYHHADSYIRFAAPESGDYRIELADTAGAGGADYRYALRIDRPRPDFRVYGTPSGIELLRMYGNEPLGVVVERIDGFKGDIKLAVASPREVYLSGSSIIPDGGKAANSFESVCGLQVAFPDCGKVYLTLSADYRKRMFHGPIKLIARSGKIEHPVIPADESMQAFAYNHLIVADTFYAATNWRRPGAENFAWPRDFNYKLTIPAGGEIKLVLLKRGRMRKNPECKAGLFDPPVGLTIVNDRETDDRIEFTLKAAPELAGRRFNQIFTVLYNYDTVNKKDNSVKRNQKTVTLPAVLIEIGGDSK